ncbi:MAG: metal ABC transporter permease [Phycisphaerales bacterium]|nr:metal ABC transporter permease [Phycisphaerales bacterium]
MPLLCELPLVCVVTSGESWYLPLLEPWTIGFMCDGLFAALLAGLSCALLGVFVVFRRMAFAGEAMSHTTLPGLVIAQSQGWSLALGALASNLITAIGISILSSGASRRRGVREDATIGVVFTGMFAFGVILTNFQGSWRDLSHLLLGNILSVAPNDLWFMVIAACVIVVTLIALHKELELSSYDASYADLIGIGATRMRLTVLVLVALAVVSGVQVVGVILTSALLVTPAATAAMFTRRLLPLMALAVALSWTAIVVGLYLSYFWSLPPGATIVFLAALIFVCAWSWRKLSRS